MKICKLKSGTTCASKTIVDSLLKVVDSVDRPLIRQFVEDKHKLTILIIEDYYFRNNATLSITIIIDERIEYSTVEVISNGGKVGLLQISYGAESSAVKKMVRCLNSMGFVEVT